jgi:hypothetical protein
VISMINHARVTGLRQSLTLSSLLLLTAGVAGAALCGTILGAAGWMLAGDLRALIVLAAVAAVLLGALRSPTPWQRNAETPRAWLELQSWQTAVRNGVALGTGSATRIGFWLWYLVPIGAFAVGSPAGGALIYGAYATARLGTSVGLGVVSITTNSARPAELALTAGEPIRRALASLFFFSCGVALAVATYAVAVSEPSFTWR